MSNNLRLVRFASMAWIAGFVLADAAFADPPGIPVKVENPVTIANPTTSVSVNNTVPVTGNVGVSGVVTIANPVNAVTVNNTTPIPVTVTNALPPLTGNVGIIGTPSVTVSNTVPVTVTNPVGTVNVANTISSPIPVTVTNATGANTIDTAKMAYAATAFSSVTSTVNQETNIIGLPFSPAVPSGMRLIVESISGACSNIPQATVVFQNAYVQANLYPVAPLAEGQGDFLLFPQAIASGSSTHMDQFSATNLRIYTDATPKLSVAYTSTGPGTTYTIPCYFSIFGYLVSMP